MILNIFLKFSFKNIIYFSYKNLFYFNIEGTTLVVFCVTNTEHTISEMLAMPLKLNLCTVSSK